MLFASMFTTWVLSVFDPGTLSILLTSLSALALGAVSITDIYRSADRYVFDIIATADGDTVTASIPHGIGSIPDVVGQQLISQALTALSAWALTTLDVTNLVFTKLASTGSGNAGAQFRVYVQRRR